MSYDYPPEPTEAEIADYESRKAVANAPTVSITGLTPDAVASIVEAAIERDYQLRERTQEAVDKAVEKCIREALNGKLDQLMDETLRPEVARIIADGWSETNNYGERVGKALSLRDRIGKYLGGDSYRKPIDAIFQAELDKALKTEAGRAFQEALNGIKAKVDGELGARIQAAFKQAIGVK